MRALALAVVLPLAPACARAVAAPPAIADAGVVVEEAPVSTVLAIVPRAEWDPAPRASGVRYRDAGKKLKDVYRTIVVHHSDFVEPAGPLGIKGYHLEVSGFQDIGYHFVIAPDGTVYEARSLERMGAHAGAVVEAARKDANGRRRHELDPDWGSIGIVLDGHYMDALPPAPQRAALALLVADLQKRFPKIERVVGHREVRASVEAKGLHVIGDPTVCPGDRLFAWLEGTRPAAIATR